MSKTALLDEQKPAATGASSHPLSGDWIMQPGQMSGRLEPSELLRSSAVLASKDKDWRPTALLDERRNERPGGLEDSPAMEATVLAFDADPVSSANRARLILLARKFAGKRFSPEDEARLEISIERVRLLVPRVTAEDFERLAELAAKQVEAQQDLGDLFKELGV